MRKQTSLIRVLCIVSMAAMALAFGQAAGAQDGSAVPANKVISDQAAKTTLMHAVISVDAARAVVDSCVDWNNARKGNPIVVFVMSPTGQIIEAHQMDGAPPIANETALMKVKAALYARVSTAEIGTRFRGDSLANVEGLIIRQNLGISQGLDYFDMPGGLPIMYKGDMIGAVGVAGNNPANGQDEMCAFQALEKVIGPQPPLVSARPLARPASSEGAAASQQP